MTKIDIENLSIEELLELNHKVIARIKELTRRENTELLRQFRIGDRVSFESEGKTVESKVVRIHKRNITIRTLHGEWVVPPEDLKKISQTENKISIWKKLFKK